GPFDSDRLGYHRWFDSGYRPGLRHTRPTYLQPRPLQLMTEQPERQAVKERRELTQVLWKGIGMTIPVKLEGTERELLEAFAVIQGVVNEYRDGGDQMVED